MSSVEGVYQSVSHLDVGESPVRQVRIKTPTVTHVRVLKTLIVLLGVLVIMFGWLAIRNARMMPVDSIGTDEAGNPVYEIQIYKD